MDIGGPIFVLAIIAILTVGWVLTTAIRARHGYPIEDELGNIIHKTPVESNEQTKLLVAENEQLKATVGRLEERLKVLERIATDPSRHLADEIDKLR